MNHLVFLKILSSKKVWVLSFVLALSFFASANPEMGLSQNSASEEYVSSEEQLCALHKASPEFFLSLLKNESSQTYPLNEVGWSRRTKGFLGTGVCWWHTRLTRLAAMMAYYEPYSARPSSKEARQILNKIKKADQFVAIPGFSNFQSFTKSYPATVVSFLNDWQASDVFHNHASWLQRLNQISYINASEMQARVQQIHRMVNLQKTPVAILFHGSQLASHSVLVVSSTLKNRNFHLELKDSLSFNNYEIVVSPQDTYWRIPEINYQVTPIIAWQSEYKRVTGRIQNICRQN